MARFKTIIMLDDGVQYTPPNRPTKLQLSPGKLSPPNLLGTTYRWGVGGIKTKMSSENYLKKRIAVGGFPLPETSTHFFLKTTTKMEILAARNHTKASFQYFQCEVIDLSKYFYDVQTTIEFFGCRKPYLRRLPKVSKNIPYANMECAKALPFNN